MLPFEAFLMRNTGINLYGIAGTLWYISAMLIVLPIVLFFVVKKKNIFKYYAAWIIPLFIYGYIIRQIGTIRTTDWVLSTLRAFAGLSLGGALYYITDFLCCIRVSKTESIILTFVEILTFVVCIIFTTVQSLFRTYNDVFFVLLIFISLTISLSRLSLTSKVHFPIFRFLGKLSLPIYCFHPLIVNIVNTYFSDYSDFCKISLSLGGTALLSIIMLCYGKHNFFKKIGATI